VEIVENGGMIIGSDGRIVAVGPEEQIEKAYGDASFDVVVNAKGKSILPGLTMQFTPFPLHPGPIVCAMLGFVDGHTHPVWSGDRVHEFKMKLAGATYMDIHKVRMLRA
jgi:imidazolonepropionase